MGELIASHWTSSFEGMSRRDRRGCDFEAYLPDSLAGWELVLPADLVAPNRQVPTRPKAP